MPNWVSNELRCTAQKNILDQLLNAVTTDENFDFNKIIPMPEHQPDLSKPNPFWGEGNNYSPEEQEPFGENNWYHWATANWGSKWNASDTYITRPNQDGDDAVIWFQTPWSQVDNIILQLSEMFPTVVFRYRYEEPDLELGGVDIVQNGLYLESYSLEEAADQDD